ncbi:MAG: glucose-6-phosphate dehydrogenase [Pseudomonadota bacterium]
MSNGATSADRQRAPARGPAPPCTLVIFGATGDLTRRLLVPALYNLSRWGLLPDDFRILAIGRQDTSAARLRTEFETAFSKFVADKTGEFTAENIDKAAWERVVGRLVYKRGDATDASFLKSIGGELEGNALFYLAVAAKLFGPIVDVLGKCGLVDERGGRWRRVVIEKPFGNDLRSAKALNEEVLRVLREDQIFRIDHFLGKETVQNIMAFRFGNGFFEPMWNRDRIDHVQITVAETVGVGTRGSFYDGTGALRDMVPNHLFQLLTMIAMEPPTSFAPDAVRDRKQDVLNAVNSFDADIERCVVRAQYGAGIVNDKVVANYRDEPKVNPSSSTETYVAMRLEIDNWRWAGVPFYLRTGKSMSERDTEIAIRFKDPPLSLFRDTSARDAMIANWLILQIQPDEGISLQFGAKLPGPDVKVDCVTMGFLYSDYFATEPATGYETLIYDAMIGDLTLFQRADNIEEGWRVVEPLLEAFGANELPMATYPAGSRGPAEADELLERDGRSWRPLG